MKTTILILIAFLAGGALASPLPAHAGSYSDLEARQVRALESIAQSLKAAEKKCR